MDVDTELLKIVNKYFPALPERFKIRIIKPENGNDKLCWQYFGPIAMGGYGLFRYNKKNHMAHRFLYEFIFGKLEKGIALHHICHNRNCVNPIHLIPLTNAQHKKLHNHNKEWYNATPQNTK